MGYTTTHLILSQILGIIKLSASSSVIHCLLWIYWMRNIDQRQFKLLTKKKNAHVTNLWFTWKFWNGSLRKVRYYLIIIKYREGLALFVLCFVEKQTYNGGWDENLKRSQENDLIVLTFFSSRIRVLTVNMVCSRSAVWVIIREERRQVMKRERHYIREGMVFVMTRNLKTEPRIRIG